MLISTILRKCLRLRSLPHHFLLRRRQRPMLSTCICSIIQKLSNNTFQRSRYKPPTRPVAVGPTHWPPMLPISRTTVHNSLETVISWWLLAEKASLKLRFPAASGPSRTSVSRNAHTVAEVLGCCVATSTRSFELYACRVACTYMHPRTEAIRG